MWFMIPVSPINVYYVYIYIHSSVYIYMYMYVYRYIYTHTFTHKTRCHHSTLHLSHAMREILRKHVPPLHWVLLGTTPAPKAPGRPRQALCETVVSAITYPCVPYHNSLFFAIDFTEVVIDFTEVTFPCRSCRLLQKLLSTSQTL